MPIGTAETPFPYRIVFCVIEKADDYGLRRAVPFFLPLRSLLSVKPVPFRSALFWSQGDIIKEKSDPVETESLLVGAEGVEPPTLCL